MQDTGNKRRVRAHIYICNRARLAQFPKYCAKYPREVRLRRIRASAANPQTMQASFGEPQPLRMTHGGRRNLFTKDDSGGGGDA